MDNVVSVPLPFEPLLDAALKYLSKHNFEYCNHATLKKEVFADSSSIDVEAIIIKLYKEGLIHYGVGDRLYKDDDTGKFKISVDGYNLISTGGFDRLTKNRLIETVLARDQITSSIGAANSSVTTNNSIQELNKSTVYYYEKQQNANWAIVAFTALTLLVSGGSFIKSCEKEQVHTIQLSPQTMQQLKKSMQSEKECCYLDTIRGMKDSSGKK